MTMLANMVNETVSSTGTGDIYLGGAVSSYTTVASVYNNGETVFYSVVDGDNREVGVGTYNSGGNYIVRDEVFDKIDTGVYTANPGTPLNLTADAQISVSPSIQSLTVHHPAWKRVHANIAMSDGSYSASKPAFATGPGGIELPFFSAAALNETNIIIPALHDIAASTIFELNISWIPSNTNTGVVRWGIEWSRAEVGAAFTSVSTTYVEQAASGVQYEHMLAAIATTVTMPEANTLLIGRLFRDGAHANDTFTGTAGLVSVSAAYQAQYIGTPKQNSNHYDWT